MVIAMIWIVVVFSWSDFSRPKNTKEKRFMKNNNQNDPAAHLDGEAFHYVQTNLINPRCNVFSSILFQLSSPNNNITSTPPNTTTDNDAQLRHYLNGLLIGCHMNTIHAPFRKCVRDKTVTTTTTVSNATPFEDVAQSLIEGRETPVSKQATTAIFSCLQQFVTPMNAYMDRLTAEMDTTTNVNSRFQWNDRYVNIALSSNNSIMQRVDDGDDDGHHGSMSTTKTMSLADAQDVFERANKSSSGTCLDDYSKYQQARSRHEAHQQQQETETVPQSDSELSTMVHHLKYSKCLTADLCSDAVLHCMHEVSRNSQDGMTEGEMFETCVNHTGRAQHGGQSSVRRCLKKLNDATRIVLSSQQE